MATATLGLGTSGSNDLSSELITKLKTAESTSVLDPITKQKTNTQTQIDALTQVQTKISDLLKSVKSFDLYTSGTNAFNEMSASTSGTSASFNTTDSSNLEPGTITINVTQLAQKDVYQSNTISDITSKLDTGTINISIGDNSYDFSTEGKTYKELVSEMNTHPDLDVGLEQVGDKSYRMVIKSSESGSANAITISQTGVDLGLGDKSNHVLTAQNMKSTIDGIGYDVSSNKVTMQNGLVITAVASGTSSIIMERDNTTVSNSITSISDKYNELVDLVNSYTLGDAKNPAKISDSSTLKSMMSDIKGILFGSYGLSNEENIFKYGISFDKDGHMQVDNSTLSTALTNNYSDIKELFVGYAEKEGIGTKLKTYLDSLDSRDGLLTNYSDKLTNKLSTLSTDYTTASDKLDKKYEEMTSQFASYTVLISQMETAFSSLKSIIDGKSSSSS